MNQITLTHDETEALADLLMDEADAMESLTFKGAPTWADHLDAIIDKVQAARREPPADKPLTDDVLVGKLVEMYDAEADVTDIMSAVADIAEVVRSRHDS